MINSERKFNEAQIANLIKQVLMALDYMHSINIMHRDLKPENLLCQIDHDQDEAITIKLTDFGFATKYKPDQLQTLSCGSPQYMAPEICKKEVYDSKVDIWAAGILTFELLAGVRPFSGKFLDQISRDICKKEPDYSLLKDKASD